MTELSSASTKRRYPMRKHCTYRYQSTNKQNNIQPHVWHIPASQVHRCKRTRNTQRTHNAQSKKAHTHHTQHAYQQHTSLRVLSPHLQIVPFKNVQLLVGGLFAPLLLGTLQASVEATLELPVPASLCQCMCVRLWRARTSVLAYVLVVCARVGDFEKCNSGRAQLHCQNVGGPTHREEQV